MGKKHKRRRDGLVYSTDPDYLPEDTPLDEDEIAPSQQRLRIHLVRLKGNKEVTVIRGFIGDDTTLKTLGKHLKTKCGVGGTVKNGEIQLQGNHRHKVLKLLLESGFTHTKLAGG